jgi:hypothetical protein
MNKFLLSISKYEITMLKNINYIIDIDKKGHFKLYYFYNMELKSIYNFIDRLHTKGIYTIIPVISMSAKDEDPQIILSNSILLTKYSSPEVVQDFLTTQLNKAILDFGITNLEDGKRFYLIFKFKRVKIDLTKIPK